MSLTEVQNSINIEERGEQALQIGEITKNMLIYGCNGITIKK